MLYMLHRLHTQCGQCLFSYVCMLQLMIKAHRSKGGRWSGEPLDGLAA